MNKFDILETHIIQSIKDHNNSYIDSFVKKNILSTLGCKKLITINGSLASGKTYTLNALINRLNSYINVDGAYKLNIKYINNMDVYDEKKVFEDIITFSKSIANKREIKLLALDDYVFFSSSFKSKLECLMLSNNTLSICIVVGESFGDKWNNIDTRIVNNITYEYYKGCLSTDNISNSDIVLNCLVENFIEYHNIRDIINNIKIIKFMDFSTIKTNLYFYNNVIEYLYILEKIDLYMDGENRLCDVLNKKYKNNENVRDVILLIENVAYDKINIKNNNCEKLYKLLEVCSIVKLKIVCLKRKNTFVNYRLLFNYLILSVNKL